MSNPDFSTLAYLKTKLNEIEPSMIFNGSTPEEWKSWRTRFEAVLKVSLGPLPDPIYPDVETVWEREEEGYTIRKIIYRTEPLHRVPAYLLIPHSAKPEGGYPALLCCHGHGSGKDNVVGIVTDADGNPCPNRENQLSYHNYDYARQFARRGYVCLAPDWRCFGECGDGGNPYPGRDQCNVNFMIGSLMGFNLLALDVWDAMRGIDYLTELSDVNADKIGCLGLSFGGTMTTFTSAIDTRIRAACISGYLSSWKTHIFDWGGICGSQYLPGLMQYGDIPEVASLIAPRPLLIERGTRDSVFPVEGARMAADQVRNVYKASGHEDRFAEDEFEGEHSFHGTVAFDFFDRFLGD